jgi:hypothetical protein
MPLSWNFPAMIGAKKSRSRAVMARKRYKPEEIVAKLRQVDVLVSQGQNMMESARSG